MYYRYGTLWSTFFKSMGFNVILSPETNENLIKLIPQKTFDKCISYQIYISHILYLEDKCDYIIISTICDYGQNNKTCKLMSNMTNQIKEYLKDKQILEYKIKYTSLLFEKISLFKIGIKLSKNIPKIILSIYRATKKQKNNILNKENNQKNLLERNNKKILIISKFYTNEEK